MGISVWAIGHVVYRLGYPFFAAFLASLLYCLDWYKTVEFGIRLANGSVGQDELLYLQRHQRLGV